MYSALEFGERSRESTRPFYIFNSRVKISFDETTLLNDTPWRTRPAIKFRCIRAPRLPFFPRLSFSSSFRSSDPPLPRRKTHTRINRNGNWRCKNASGRSAGDKKKPESIQRETESSKGVVGGWVGWEREGKMQAKTFRYKERWRAKKAELHPHFHGSLVWNRVRARQKDSGTRTGPPRSPTPSPNLCR